MTKQDEITTERWRELAIASMVIAALLAGALLYQSATRESYITIRLDSARGAQ